MKWLPYLFSIICGILLIVIGFNAKDTISILALISVTFVKSTLETNDQQNNIYDYKKCKKQIKVIATAPFFIVFTRYLFENYGEKNDIFWGILLVIIVELLLALIIISIYIIYDMYNKGLEINRIEYNGLVCIIMIVSWLFYITYSITYFTSIYVNFIFFITIILNMLFIIIITSLYFQKVIIKVIKKIVQKIKEATPK